MIIGQEKTLYCNRVAPNDPKGRLCRKVGTHIKAQKLHDVAYEKAYSRAYDRLKHSRNAGIINAETWNKLVAEIQKIRSDVRGGIISDAEVKVTFPTIPSSLSKVTLYLLSHQGFAVADAVVVSSMVTAIAVHNTFFFITFHLLNLYLPYLATQTYHRR